MSKTEISKGLAFMLAAKAAMPASLGDRERCSAMHDAMKLAVRNRFAFQPEDVEALKRMTIDTCVGVFRAMDLSYYHIACEAGGTYPRVWEKERGIKAWRAAKAVHTHWSRPTSFVDDSRVCPGVIVLLPPSFSTEEPELASYMGMQVWWVTDFTDQSINLCRYKPDDNTPLRKPGGHPARRRQLTRDEWDIFQLVMKSLAGEDVRMKWTQADELAAGAGGWDMLTGARPRIIRLPLVKGGFATDEEAVQFVRSQAAKGNALAAKALLIHERAAKMPEPDPAQKETPDPADEELIELAL